MKTIGSKETQGLTGAQSVVSAKSRILSLVLVYSLTVLCSSFYLAQERQGQVQTTPSGEIYEGRLVDGLREGYGKLTYVNGSIYEGEFANNLPSGSDGLLTFTDGRTYRGTFVNGHMQGYGTLEWPNGDVYVGTFDANSITGRGKYFWQLTKATYEGTVEGGMLHGVGVMSWPDGRRYEGSYLNGHRHGFGIFRLADGSVYRGFFESDQRNGDGVFEYPDGVKEFQRWANGSLVASYSLQSLERCRLEINGYQWMFAGDECVNGHAHGTGTAVRVDGLAYISNGSFVVGQMVAGVITSLSGQEIP